MHILRISTAIDAPPDRCFDLARSVDVHVQSAGRSGEKVVGGRLSGLLELGDEVTWQGRHLGVKQRLTSCVMAFDRPRYFQDRMIRGAFRELVHDHYFERAADGTTGMIDVVKFAAPFGPLGWLAERAVIGPHLRRFIRERGIAIKLLAESDEWRRYIPEC